MCRDCPCISSPASLSAAMANLQALCSGLPLQPLPENRGRWTGVPHAPVRTPGLSPAEEKVRSWVAVGIPWCLWDGGAVVVGVPISCSL